MPTYLRAALLSLFLYLFLVSISLLGASFKLLGGDFAAQLLATAQNPFLGLFIGILATSIVQSSSTVTSLTVGLAGSGALDLHTAIPIIMGSNVGTTVTNTLVAAGHINRPAEFRRAFAAATLDDVFNLLAILVLFPLQLMFNFLGVGSQFLAQVLVEAGGLQLVNPLKSLVEPSVSLLVWLSGESGMLAMLLAVSLLFVSLQQIVHNLKLLVIKRVEVFFNDVMFRSAASAMLLGLVCTFLVQSSSITTSLIVPLAGAGFLSLVQIFPYVLGANVGTTATALLAALMTGEEVALTVAFAHLLFNVSGIVFIWPVKRVPIRLSGMLAEYTLKSRLVPIAYILLLFFALPLALIYLMR